MWVPIATSNDYQSVEITSINLPVEYKLLKDKEFNNTILYLEPSASQSKKTFEIAYKVKRLERGPMDETLPVDGKYLSDNRLMPVGGRFAEIAKEATRGRDGSSIMKARALYDYVIDNMRYMKYGIYGTCLLSL